MMNIDEQLSHGTQIEKYVIEGMLGQGGMATVYKVRHQTLGTAHALKVLTQASKSVRRRLMLEGQVQARLRHNNIVSVTDVLDLDEGIGLVLEYISGAALDELLLKQTLTLPQVDQLAEGIFRGVSYAHDHGLIHRDLKPANILLQHEGNRVVPKVADFGLVKAAGEVSTTRSGVAMGTPRYMSPEQIRDAKSVDHRTDVFALGAILYEMLTAETAFCPNVEDLLSIFNAIADNQYIPVQELRPETPTRMIRAIDLALSVDPERRPQTVSELRAVWFGTEYEVDVGWDQEGAPKPTKRSLPTQYTSVQATLAPEVPPPSTASAPGPSPRRWGRAVFVGLLGFTLLLSASLLLFGTLRSNPTPVDTPTLHGPPPDAPPPTITKPTPSPAVTPPRRPSPTPTPAAPPPKKPPTPAKKHADTQQAPVHSEPIVPIKPPPEPPPAEPTPAVAPKVRTSFSITGARGYLRANGTDHHPGTIAPGVYSAHAFFDDLPVTVTPRLVVERGDHVKITCQPMFKLCKVKTQR